MPSAVDQSSSSKDVLDDKDPGGGLAAAMAEIEEDGGDDSAPEDHPQEAELVHVDLPEKLNQTVEVRIAVWQQILRIEEQRRTLSRSSGTRDTRAELSRQTNELKRIPDAEKLAQASERIAKKLSQPISVSDEEKVALEAEETDPKELFKSVFDLGTKQNKLLTTRARLDVAIPAAAKEIAAEDRMSQVGAKYGLDTQTLVGWTFYALGLEQQIAKCKKAIEEHRRQVSNEEDSRKNQKSGLMGKLRRDSKADSSSVPELDPEIEEKRLAAGRELLAIEQPMTDMFWDLYEELSWIYCSGKMEAEDEPYARAYLRYGLVSAHPGLIAQEKADYIINDCTENVYQLTSSEDSTHALYADEFMRAIHDQQVVVSPDEDLELNQRGSDAWKADRTWRQAVFGKSKLELFEVKRSEIVAEMQTLEKNITELEEKFQALKKRQANAKPVQQELLELRPQATRYRQMVDRLDEKFIPNTKDMTISAQSKMGEATQVLTHELVVKREAKFVRRLSRLAARLKTPYPHWILRDYFEPGSSSFNDRDTVLSCIGTVEYADHYLFHQVIIPNKKKDRQLTIRMSPVFLIVPARGLMGISVIQRQSTDSGKIMVPLMSQRQDSIGAIVTEALADFGWDCSLEEAGADWITSDSLCAAYAAVRWNYRSRSPKAQKKAGFDKKKRDRQDWRGHYALYVNTARDSGKKLFYKCFDVYEVIVKYIGLPAGVERLRRD